jgi:hypothetical protein
MPYEKNSWAAGNRLSIERMNHLESGIAAANQKNAANESAAADALLILAGVEDSITQAHAKNAAGQAILDIITPPPILSDSWGYFDDASVSNSTAESVTRVFSGFTTRVNDPTLYANNGNAIAILQPGTYLVMRAARVAAAAMDWSTLDGAFQFFMYGGGSGGYRLNCTISSIDILTINPSGYYGPGYEVEIRVNLHGDGSMTLSGSMGKIAIQKIA